MLQLVLDHITVLRT